LNINSKFNLKKKYFAKFIANKRENQFLILLHYTTKKLAEIILRKSILKTKRKQFWPVKKF